jgi:2,3-dihydroxybiphenyl 1,2-dioxygenase
MELKSLGYIGIQSAQLENWTNLVTRLLGMQEVDRGGPVRAFRMDDRKQRFVVDGENDDGLGFLGWEVGEKSDLESLAARLEANSTAVTAAGKRLADERHVTELITFKDPGGNRIEVFWKPHLATEAFVPGRPISGFRTGPLGMGHAVLNVEDIEPMLVFYRDLLGFHVSDFGLKPHKIYFLHLNGRHHSIAMLESGKRSMHHFMVEFGSLDDVGQGYDLAQLDEGRVAYTLGRHTNDHVTSFYSHTPSGFFIECGWGGRIIDPNTWKSHETFDGPSLWGHERLYMPDEPRARFRNMRLDAAARGVRVPDPSVPAIDCPWLDSMIRREGPPLAPIIPQHAIGRGGR